MDAPFQVTKRSQKQYLLRKRNSLQQDSNKNDAERKSNPETYFNPETKTGDYLCAGTEVAQNQ